MCTPSSLIRQSHWQTIGPTHLSAQALLGHTTSRRPCQSSGQTGLGVCPGSLAQAGGEGLLPATLSFPVGSPAWRCKELPSALALSLSPGCGQQTAGHTGPQLCSGGDPLCLPASSVSAAGHTACRSPCQPPGQTGLAGCLPAGGAVTQLLPGPGQTSLRSARLQSEDLNQASLHPAKRRPVLGVGGQRLSHPRSCPTRGSGGSRGPLHAVRCRGGGAAR